MVRSLSQRINDRREMLNYCTPTFAEHLTKELEAMAWLETHAEPLRAAIESAYREMKQFNNSWSPRYVKANVKLAKTGELLEKVSEQYAILFPGMTLFY